MQPATVNLGLFGQSLALTAAQDQGFFDRQGLTVRFHQVLSSTQQFQALASGEYDLAQTSVDNVINYRLNERTPLGGVFAARAIAALDYGLGLRLVARQGIATVADLRGATIAVDAEASGFAYVLYSILTAHGLQRGTEYALTALGGVFHRYQGLLSGATDGTLLSNGYEVRAAFAGHTALDPVAAVANPYLGSVLAASEPWLAAHGEVATRFLRAYLGALRWVFDSANAAACVALIGRQSATPPDLAARLFSQQVAPGVGLIPDGVIRPEALAGVLALRQRYGGFEREQDLARLATEAGGIYATEYLRAARLG